MTARRNRTHIAKFESARLISGFRSGRTIVVSAVLIGAMAGCAVDTQNFGLTQAQIDERTPFSAVPVAAAWVNAPNIVTVLQRDMGLEVEQKIGLSNRTSVPGDNIIFARTHVGPRGLRFEEVIGQFGSMPSPFVNAESGDLMQGTDEIGEYFWTTEQVGGSTTCILGLRRVESGMRRIPDGAGAMDILVRNCVPGSEQEALAPLLTESIGYSPVPVTREGETRMLSPLAAPSAGLDRLPPAGGAR